MLGDSGLQSSPSQEVAAAKVLQPGAGSASSESKSISSCSNVRFESRFAREPDQRLWQRML